MTPVMIFDLFLFMLVITTKSVYQAVKDSKTENYDRISGFFSFWLLGVFIVFAWHYLKVFNSLG